MKSRTALQAAVISILLASDYSWSQLDEIVVTATHRAENLQDVPASVAVLSGQELRQAGFADLEEASAFIPNVLMRDLAVGQSLYVRGIGTSTVNEAFEQAVALFSDGVYFGRDVLGQLALFDLERVEVVYGPQPIFAGQSATAGALSVITRRPGADLNGRVSVAYGSDEEANLEFAIGVPISDRFGLRVAGRYYALDDAGYFRISDRQPTGIKENRAARITGAWSPTEALKLTFKYEVQEIWQLGVPFKFTDCDLDPVTSIANPQLAPGMPAMCALDILHAGIDYDPRRPYEARLGAVSGGGSIDVWDVVTALDARYGLAPGARTTGGVSFTPLECAANAVLGCSPVARGLNRVREFNEEETRELDADVLSVSADWTIGDDLSLTAISSLVEYDKQDWLDVDWSMVAIGSAVRAERFVQRAQEVRLASSPDRTLEWMVGLYYQDHQLDGRIDIYVPRILGPPAGVWTLPGSISIGFGSRLIEQSAWTSVLSVGTWNVSEVLRLNFGARYQRVRKDGDLTPTVASLLPGAADYSPFGPYPGGLRSPLTGLTVDGDDVLPEVGFQWEAADRLMLYGKYAEAFKAGGFILAPAPGGDLPNPPTYGPESAEGIEVGVKGRFDDRDLELGVSWYDTDYKDLQVSVFDSETSLSVTRNVGAANTRGFELDARWAVGANFTLGFRGSLGRARYEEYAMADACNSLTAKLFAIETGQRAANCTVDLSGADMPFAPRWTAGVAPRLVFTLGSRFVGSFAANLFFSGRYLQRDRRHPIDFVDGHHRLDLRFSLAPTDGDWEVAFYGRNVTDEAIVNIVAENNFQSRSLALDYDAAGGSVDRGARFGVQLGYAFGRD